MDGNSRSRDRGSGIGARLMSGIICSQLLLNNICNFSFAASFVARQQPCDANFKHIATCRLDRLQINNKDDTECDRPSPVEKEKNIAYSRGNSNTRRRFFSQSTSSSIAMCTALLGGITCNPSPSESKGFDIFQIFRKEEVTEVVEVEVKTLSSEACLLSLLPVKNPVFRTLQKDLESLSSVQRSLDDMKVEKAWKNANQYANNALLYLDAQRGLLEPVFNENDSTIVQITKNERGGRLIGELRSEIEELIEATTKQNLTATFMCQKKALLALAGLGELLVTKFPYDVPQKGMFSYLPRLMGRATVDFKIVRDSRPMGNITIIADGYTAPITAGNFIDLCARGFYTGLPVKVMKKTLGLKPFANEDGILASISKLDLFQRGASQDEENDSTRTVNLPMLGSYQEGFYDPLTAQLRKIPLEIVRLDKDSGNAKVTYSEVSGFSEEDKEKAVLEFEIPGLVAMNHNDQTPNGASSEFFVLTQREINAGTTKLINGRYAPFGYVVGGYDLLQNLKEGDVIGSTTVDEWGLLNLLKIRGASIQDVIQSNKDD